MKIINTFLIGLLSLSITGCDQGQSPEEVQNALRDSIMVVHDEVMPRMSEIHRIKSELKDFEGSLVVDESVRIELEGVITELEAADEGMMSWMSQFTQPASMRETKSHQDIMLYLESEKKKVDLVKYDILNSIERGRKLFEALKASAPEQPETK